MIPKVSVIIPVYNVENYLRQCLDSVLNQTLKEIEVICVDDGSTDSSLEILKEYAKKDKRITIITQKNLYAGVARNAGLAVARGKYLSFLDSDDFFELNMLEEMYNHAKNLDLDICVCDANIYDQVNHKYLPESYLKINLIPKDKQVFNRHDLQENICKFINPAAWTKLFKRNFVIQNKLYFQNLRSCNDVGMVFASLLLADKISVVNKVLVHYRYNTTDQITKKRGETAICIIYAYYYVRQLLQNKNIDIELLRKIFKSNIIWEFSCCNNTEQKQFKKQAANIMKNEFKEFKSCFRHENFVVHFIKHMKDVIKPKLKTAWEYPIRVHEKYHRLKNKIREIKNSK